MKYSSCVADIIHQLHSLPPKWAEKIACNMCKLMADDDCEDDEVDCDGIRDCQTVTYLSDWEIVGDMVCISFTDEHGVRVKRCFAISSLNDEINETDGSCFFENDTIWGQLTPTQKWQAIIDKICLCCDSTPTTTTTTTTSTTTTTTSTTTTTTLPPCEDCSSAEIVNDNAFPIEVFYIDCNTLQLNSMWILAMSKGIIECFCDGSLYCLLGVFTLISQYNCGTTTSTTTTTTILDCNCYAISNGGGPGSPDRWVDYIDCEGNPTGQGVPVGTTIYVCASSIVNAFGCTVVLQAPCTDGCGPLETTTTTTTTTTSTTTTTTEEPTTTTTTTSTTTTTTLPPESDIVYFTNGSTNSDKGARIWFSQNDYYTPNTPGNVVAANCAGPSSFGIVPAIAVGLRYWRDDITDSIDDGLGNVRTEDGTKTVTITTDALSYNVSSGAWQVALGIFTLDEGANIAAFEITSVTSPYYAMSINHTISLPPANHFIRVHNTFSAGGTSVIWFDLV